MSKSEQQSRCALPSTRRQFLKMTSAAAAVSSLSCWTQALAKPIWMFSEPSLLKRSTKASKSSTPITKSIATGSAC